MSVSCRRQPGHWQFDIEGYVAARLAEAGVTKVECLGEDTYSQPDRFSAIGVAAIAANPAMGAKFL